MSKQPEALRLASVLEGEQQGIDLGAEAMGWAPSAKPRLEAAAELRRQHALIEEMREALRSVDSDLSRVLHELAGSASLCWSPKPEGVFDSSKAIEFVEGSISEIRLPIRATLAKAEAQQWPKP